MGYNIPDWDNVTREVDRTFTQETWRNLTAAIFFPTRHGIPDEGIKKIERWKVNDLTSASVISMDIPMPSPDDGVIEAQTPVDIVNFERSMRFDRREYAAIARAGWEPLHTMMAGKKLGYDLNDYLFLGSTVGVGPATGLLNASGINTVDNSATTNWTNGVDVANDLNEGIGLLLDDNHNGPFRLLMNPSDYARAMGAFIKTGSSVGSSAVVRETLSAATGGLIEGVHYDKVVASGKAYLIEVSPMNYDYAGLYDIGRWETQKVVDPYTGALTMTWRNFVAPRVHRATGTCEVTFDFAT